MDHRRPTWHRRGSNMGPHQLPVRRCGQGQVPDGRVRAETVPEPRLHRHLHDRWVQRADGVQLGVRELPARDKVRAGEYIEPVP
ncbi:unnamed protein product [Linum tenue]|uniref:Uncharacterized protein n=1 Tax=Linum tenue TaxID=586396 RepID=A0AAV0JY43_9ROSI|nr:unnamed protein product [Linum tenue]